MPEETKNQTVWRDFSANKNSTGGFVVWEVLEVIGEPSPDYTAPFIKCADGSWIYICCTFFFAEEQARGFFDEDGSTFYQSVIQIP